MDAAASGESIVGPCALNVSFWPIATARILVADRRFRGITDMAGGAAGRTRMTQSGHVTISADYHSLRATQGNPFNIFNTAKLGQ